jgi:diguanylate cyclase (GGDEF)-like protein/PAS domain S-box-containing protein
MENLRDLCQTASMSDKPLQVNSPEFQSSLVRAIHEASPDGILVVNDNGIIVSHNHRFIEVWHLSDEQLHGAQPGTAIGSVDDQILGMVLDRVKEPTRFLARVQELYGDPELEDHSEIELKDGRTLERHSTVLRGDDQQYLGRVWFFRDITSQKQAQAELLELAHHDALTGVANRRYFFERANQEFIRAKRYLAPLSIASLDIDHFKQVNDQFGHAAGDEVLKSLCNNSQQLLRETELFARIGGEEFAVLMPDTDMEGARHLAERIRQAVADLKPRINGQEISCTISLGIATLRSSDTSIEECLQRADRAMYLAKKNGRNRVEIEA